MSMLLAVSDVSVFYMNEFTYGQNLSLLKIESNKFKIP